MVNAFYLDTSSDSYSLNPGAVTCGGFIVSNATIPIEVSSSSDYLSFSDEVISFDNNLFYSYKISVPNNISFGSYDELILVSDGDNNKSFYVNINIDSELEKSLTAVYDSFVGYVFLFVLFLIFIFLGLIIFLFRNIIGGKS